MVTGLTRKARHRGGFVLIAFTLALLLILGCAGLTFDIGRMYITRSESQTFCDAAALAAASKLDGTSSGITNAISAAQAIPKRYQFGTVPFAPDQIAVTFSQDGASWSASPANASGYIYARVATRVPLNMMLMPVVTGAMSTDIAARATAKQVAVNNAMTRVFPFGPLWVPPGGTTIPEGSSMPSPPDPFGMIPAKLPDGGYQQGGVYTLRGPSKLKEGELSKMCVNDRTELALTFRRNLGKAHIGDDYIDDKKDNSARGYLWDTNSANDIRQQILGSEVPDGHTVAIGDVVLKGQPGADCGLRPCLNPGVKQTEVDAIKARAGESKNHKVSGDTDSTSPNYATYVAENRGNGDRVVVAPIVSGPCESYEGAPTCPQYPPEPYAPPALAGTKALPNSVLGFAGFFLLPPSEYGNPQEPVCAEYIGPWVPNAAGASLMPGGSKLLLVE